MAVRRTARPCCRRLLREVGGGKSPRHPRTIEALRLVLAKRKDKLRGYFDELAGRFGRNYVPGRSWKGLSEMFLGCMPPLVVADLGAGEGTLSLLLAQRAEPSSPWTVRRRWSSTSRRSPEATASRISNTGLGDLEELPLSDGEADLALLHQSLHHALHPAKRSRKPGAF